MTRAALSLLVARVVSALTTLVVLGVVARTRSEQELGLVAIGLTVGLALAVLPEAGMTALFVRDVAREPASGDAGLGAMLAIRAVALPGAAAVAWLMLEVAYGPDATTLVIVAAGPALQQVGELARATLIARGRTAVASAHSVVENVAWCVVLAVTLGTHAGLDAAFLASAVAVIVVDAAGFGLVRVLIGIRPRWQGRATAAGLIRRAGPFATFSTLAVVLSRADTLLVGLLLPNGVAAAGAYYAAARLVATGEYLPDAVSRAIYPDLSRMFWEARGEIHDLLMPPTRTLLSVALSAAFGLALVGGWLMTLLYGPTLGGYEVLVAGLGAVLPFRFLGMFFGSVLTSADAQGRRTLAFALAVLAVLVVDVPFLHDHGVGVAVLGSLIGWLIVAGVNLHGVHALFGSVIARRDIAYSVLYAAVAFMVGLIVRMSGAPANELLATAVYAAIAFTGLLRLAGVLRSTPLVGAHRR